MRAKIKPTRCLGCGEPCSTAFCEACAPPSPGRFAERRSSSVSRAIRFRNQCARIANGLHRQFDVQVGELK